LAALAVLALLVLTGCGKGQGVVTGTVTFKDRPLIYGSVVILASDGIPRNAHILPGGSYTLPDVPCGDARLAVHSPDPAQMDELLEAEKIKIKKGLSQSLERKLPDIDRAKWFPIPPAYGDFEKSGLELSVQKGSNSYDIRLK
jgi:hypothetical protein